ncbi:protein translocase subunit SecA [Campylobacterota bacterium]|nr:protein translocase subunit SecA [Campylobacterota bacterium]GHV04356.1 protein translocase subunit SecA [Campylobacterota bacterium]
MFATIFTKLLGTRNEKELKRYKKRLKAINQLEERYAALSDAELQSAFGDLRTKVQDGETLESVLNDSFAITREASKRVLNMRHFDVQIVGALVLHDGRISEMKTGEGKTLVATMPVALNALSGKGVHVVTVNDYLAKRDGTEMGVLYKFLGFSVGILTSTLDLGEERREAYAADITYGTNNEFGFDYLRDNMKYSFGEMTQREHNYAIVDEVDSILIDEARTPLIISGPTNRKMSHYEQANTVAKKLIKNDDFTVDEKNRVVLVTDSGIEKAQALFGVGNLYDMENAILAHHLDQALKANYLFETDVHYVVKDGEIVIVDEFTGRLSTGRRYSEGLHQALEAKEGVLIKEESQTLADITFQNYFRLYKKLAGMTGTAQTEASEFSQIYSLDVISIPTNLPVGRADHNDLIYSTEAEKFEAVIEQIKLLHKKGQPVLVGTVSIEKSEALSAQLQKSKIPHNVLNAKQHEKEAQIILDAGNVGMVTIATNMAGRGVDIKLDDETRALGGLFIIGTERHESRRIDNQLRGRSGRQGDPGESRFYLSLEDNLLRIFGSDRIKSIMSKLGIKRGEFIESGMVTRAVEKAQKKVESMHFEARKHLLEYDDVANAQRKIIYEFRRDLLKPDFAIVEKIVENREFYLSHLFNDCSIIDGLTAEEFNTDRLVQTVREELKIEIDESALNDKNAIEVKEFVTALIADRYNAKMSLVAPEQRSEIERILYLQNLDELWREHLYQMDVLKTGIGLRGYNQKDPLVEYKKESFLLFGELTARLKTTVAKTLHSLQLRMKDEQQAIETMRAQMQNADRDAKLTHIGSATSGANASVQHIEKKIPRNDPCPCGSGKKYKNCCGLSGPKRGIFAEK